MQTGFTLVETHDRGIAANQVEIYDKIIPLDLTTIRYSFPETKKKGDKWVPLSEEEKYLLGQLQPHCNAKYIKNEYFLTVNIGYDDCTCGTDLPTIKLPILVVPVEQTG